MFDKSELGVVTAVSIIIFLLFSFISILMERWTLIIMGFLDAILMFVIYFMFRLFKFKKHI